MDETAATDQPPDQGEPSFRWRGGAVSRIEGLSDGVFALSLTLLVVSLRVPESFEELMSAFRQVPVFLLTYGMFGWIWHLHHRFHRRFGLEDTTTIVCNLALLFVVLLYVYPLRYLARTLCEMFGIVDPPGLIPEGNLTVGLRADQMQGLMLLYGAGMVAVFGMLTLLYRHAWKLRDRLGLDARERILTRASVRELTATACVGVVSMGIASIGDGGWQFLAGISYSSVGLIHSISGRRTSRELRELDASESVPALDAG